MSKHKADPHAPSVHAIRKTVTVPLSPDGAYALFTRGMAEWWPTERFSVAMYTGGTVRDIVVEPHGGGAVYEVAADGARHDWGRVVRWDPPHALDLDWFPGLNSAEASRITIRFTPAGRGTRVELVHDGLHHRADSAALLKRYTSGWDDVLSPFVDVATKRVPIPAS